MTVKIIVFVILAVLIFIMFRRELRSPTGHGFFMFFAFEALLALLFFNIGFWFADAFSWHGIFSWTLLAVSGLTAIAGFYGLKRHGKPVDGWEETTVLITEGIFRYIRHPLYTSLILLAVGIFLKQVTLRALIICLVAMICLVIASLLEEKENCVKFGGDYTGYQRASKRYIPFVL